jgi:C1A family cysteine protease
MIYHTLALATIVATASAGLFPEDPVQQKAVWETFKQNHQKSYSTMEEESRRFGHFLENLKAADRRNALEIRNGGDAVHGVTPLSDMSQAEFEANFLTSDVSMRSVEGRQYAVVDTAVDTTLGLVDWTGKYTTAVKDQGYCGSCWAFSATEQIESDAMRTLGKSYVLSPEQITQCATGSYGCNGGWTEKAYAYVKSVKGIVTEATYPYTSYYGTTGTCKVDTTKAVIGVSTYYTVSGESSMASYVQTKGPLSVCLDASSWNSYTGGIMSVCGKSVDHCVQAVGVDATSTGYWKVRNSWGTSWGESGFIRLKYGQNTCAITNDPTYTVVTATA